MSERHQLQVDSDNGQAVVFLCPEVGCGRRVVVDRNRRDYTVIDRGDFFALHSGAVGPIHLRGEVA